MCVEDNLSFHLWFWVLHILDWSLNNRRWDSVSIGAWCRSELEWVLIDRHSSCFQIRSCIWRSWTSNSIIESLAEVFNELLPNIIKVTWIFNYIIGSSTGRKCKSWLHFQLCTSIALSSSSFEFKIFNIASITFTVSAAC